MGEPSQQLSVALFADYFQFYLWDSGVSPGAPSDWTEEDVESRLKAAQNVVVVSPVRNMTVPVKVEVHAAEPELRAEVWDHIAECSLELPTGQLELHECTGSSAGVLKVNPGPYRVRACYGRLGSVSGDGLRGDDHYLVLLWRAPVGPLRVVKRWPGGDGA